MLRKPEKAERSVLMNYVSKMQPVALWSCLKDRHFVVAASVGHIDLAGTEVLKPRVPVHLLNTFIGSQKMNFVLAAQEPFNILNAVVTQNISYAGGNSTHFHLRWLDGTFVSQSVEDMRAGSKEIFTICAVDGDKIEMRWNPLVQS
ncbi:hypothetical protein N7468_003882 [Penicillium chermesinum]|uniref:Uncharacterized protein n=1 Tax=Penicillium chermesinum TaxID=63820 RepID=A0A9W9P9U3_9EURO|nr:uncharacterized protein N7468_003882 [Penicillium chermesinum]KAJ5239263.1 hypothetical protein N7468_003882 [Penicillium chermesinum]KAJ6164895.1 hypothetical protein N7470_003567 [Penicillium chermesinum]